MAADQSLIQATRAMGVSKYRDDSGWVKALASIGKYVASKQALKQQLNINKDAAFSTIEDADIKGLLDFKTLANEYTKIMAKQPSWSKKYKQATKDYNDLMQAVELNKAGNTAFATYEKDLIENNGQISKTHVGKEDNIGDEIIFKRYTKTFTNEGPSLYFPELGMDILVKDLPTFTKISEGKDVTTAMKNIVDKNGAKVKVKGGRFIESNVSKDLNSSMSWWGDKKQRDIQMFDTEYTYNGQENYTFGKYIAEKHNYAEVLDGLDFDIKQKLAKEQAKENPDPKKIQQLKNALKYFELKRANYKFGEKGYLMPKTVGKSKVTDIRLKRSIDFVKKYGEEIGGKTKVIPSKAKFNALMDKLGIKGAKGTDGFYDPNTKTFYVNKEVAREKRAVNVGSHELLHGIMWSTLNGPLRKVKDPSGNDVEVNITEDGLKLI